MALWIDNFHKKKGMLNALHQSMRQTKRWCFFGSLNPDIPQISSSIRIGSSISRCQLLPNSQMKYRSITAGERKEKRVFFSFSLASPSNWDEIWFGFFLSLFLFLGKKGLHLRLLPIGQGKVRGSAPHWLIKSGQKQENLGLRGIRFQGSFVGRNNRCRNSTLCCFFVAISYFGLHIKHVSLYDVFFFHFCIHKALFSFC